ncbi:MAG: tyrosine-type recombinase/integrase [Candidatus Anammoxibacter sp.]
MSRLYKRGDVYWYGFRHNGIRYRQSTGKTKRWEADDVFDKKKNEIKNGECSEAKKINDCKFSELTKKYLEWAESRKSYRDKKSLVSQLETWFLGKKIVTVNEIGYKEVDLFQSERMKTHSAATTNRIMSCLKHMFAKGVKWKMVKESVLNDVRGVKQLRENNKRLRYLTVEESKTLISCCNEDFRPIVITALNTGMRRGEILNLKWSNVDLKNGFVLLEDTKNGERREIPINNTLKDTFLVLTRRFDDSYVFF